MSLTNRLLITFFSVVLISGYLFYDMIIDQLELGISQSTEETMIDTANLLAELVENEITTRNLTHLNQAVDDYTKRNLKATIHDIVKTKPSLRVYITDDDGVVIHDSGGEAVGEDFSQWNDIYLTLQGEYGARSTRLDPQDELSTILHVAAPIIVGRDIVGVVTLAKSKLSLQPYVERIQNTMLYNGLLLLLVSLGVCLLLAFWLTRSIRRLVSYADNVAGNTGPPPPVFSEPEFNQLSAAMQAMRRRLDGKEYVADYIESLTHEIKSPVAAVKGALELIDENMPVPDRERFFANMQHEMERLEEITGRLLELAELEHMDELNHAGQVDLNEILQKLIGIRSIQCLAKRIDIVTSSVPSTVYGDEFLLTQAINNLLDNAMNYSAPDSKIEVTLTRNKESSIISIRDYGPGIPNYAKDKVFDRFFSLPNPVTGKKSTGLGLSFVRQIMTLHNAEISIETPDQGSGPGTEIKIIFNNYKTT